MEPALRRGDLEALQNQMLLATRRLRAAISLFSGMVNDSKAERIKSALKWVATQMAAARDLDVFLAEAIAPAREQRRHDPVAEGLKGFAAEIGSRRDKAFERAQLAAGSSRFQDLVLDMAEWIAVGPWTTSCGGRARLRDQPVEQHAASELSRRRRKIKRRGRALGKLDPGRRHKLRIQAKKVRYATEFFAGLFRGKAAKRRRRPYLSALKGLQERTRASQ